MTKDLIMQALEVLLANGYVDKDDLIPILKKGFSQWIEDPAQIKLKNELSKKN